MLATQCGFGECKRDVMLSFNTAKRWNSKWHLNQLFQIIERVASRPVGVGQIWKVLFDGVLDHCLIRSNHESGVFCEQEKPNCFHTIDHRCWETAVEIVNEHDQFANLGGFDE